MMKLVGFRGCIPQTATLPSSIPIVFVTIEEGISPFETASFTRLNESKHSTQS